VGRLIEPPVEHDLASLSIYGPDLLGWAGRGAADRRVSVAPLVDDLKAAIVVVNYSVEHCSSKPIIVDRRLTAMTAVLIGTYRRRDYIEQCLRSLDEQVSGVTGVIQALLARGFNFTLVDGLIEHTATFTCNPSMWRAEVFALGWPQVAFSENVKRHQLLAHGYRFAYLPGIRVAHHGINSGHSY
jgi:hypothetical protein